MQVAWTRDLLDAFWEKLTRVEILGPLVPGKLTLKLMKKIEKTL